MTYVNELARKFSQLYSDDNSTAATYLVDSELSECTNEEKIRFW